MDKPTQDELDTCRDVLDYLIENAEALEPHAIHTINVWKEAASMIPCEDDIEEH